MAEFSEMVRKYIFKNQNKEKINVTVLGKDLVGKKSLVYRYIKYSPPPPEEIGVTLEDRIKTGTKIDDKYCEIEIYILNNDEYYQNYIDRWMDYGDGFLLVFAINDKSSFDLIPSYIESIIKRKHDEAFPMVLVGNKQDLDNNREVSYDTAKQLADSWNMEYIEASAKINLNCDEAFEHLAAKVYEYKKNLKMKRSSCPCSIY